MRYEELPVTPALITWARTCAGISVDPKRSSAFKRGRKTRRFLRIRNLSSLADAFKVPVAVFSS